MTTYELIQKRRSIRKFQQEPLARELLGKCVNAGRLAPCGANIQPLEYIVVTDPDQCAQIFPHTAWAGYLDNGTPQPGEQPVAYIFILTNTEHRASADMDVGIAAENIVLTALEEGVGSCMIGSLDRDALRMALEVPDHCEITLAVALGYPAEEPVMEAMTTESIKYYLDNEGVLHVPKRAASAITHWDTY